MSRILAILLLASGLLLAGCSSTLSSRKDYLYQEIYYVTTRAETDMDDPGKRYGEDRGPTSFGAAMVAVDPDKTFGSFATAGSNHALQQDDLLTSQPVQQVVELGEPDFLDAIGRYAGESGQPPAVLIYIHGYMKSFRRASTISAQLRYELDFPGPVIAFTWPSTNSVSGYVADLENLNWSEPELRHLIDRIHTRFPATPIHILAHSMGNQALLTTLDYLKREYNPPESWPIGEIILVAPDVDREIFFRDIAERLKTIPSRKTLYVSAKDFPLFASATVYQYARLGDSRDGVPVVEGIETVDVSDAVPLFDGHGYYEANRETIDDLYYLLNKGLGADQRPTLEPAESNEGKFWRLKASAEMD